VVRRIGVSGPIMGSVHGQNWMLALAAACALVLVALGWSYLGSDPSRGWMLISIAIVEFLIVVVCWNILRMRRSP